MASSGSIYRKWKWDFNEVAGHLEEKDSRMAELFHSYGPLDFKIHKDPFEALIGSVISQQVSTKAAASIKAKLISGIGGELRPEVFAAHDATSLREFGISNQKAGYILDIASHFNHSPQKFSSLNKFTDEEIIDTLTEIKGIGAWTAQMFLMFTLGRHDVFPVADLGIKNAMIKVYRWRSEPDKEKMLRASQKWAPHRTAVSRYLWHSLSNTPQ